MVLNVDIKIIFLRSFECKIVIQAAPCS